MERKFFAKIDLKSAFWQIELHPDSRKFTVFYFRGKLYRFKRLVMGLKPAQAELNNALQPLFAHIPDTHIIHDDLIIASKDKKSYKEAVKMVLEVAEERGLTFNPDKCVFGKSEIKFWGLIISADGIYELTLQRLMS